MGMFGKGRFTIRSKLIVGYLIILLFLGSALLLLNNQISSLQRAIEFITEHDITVHNLANQVEKHVIDMETGQRGYIIAGDEAYLEPYITGKTQWLLDYEELSAMVEDNPGQQRKLQLIKAGIEEWIKTAGEPTIAFKRAGDNASLQSFFKVDAGKQIVDPLRKQLEDFRQSELALTQQRVSGLNGQNAGLQLALTIIFAIIVVISIITGTMLSNSIVNTIKAVIGAINEIATADGSLTGKRIVTNSRDEVMDLSDATNRLLDNQERQYWLQTGIAEVATSYQGQTEISSLGYALIRKLAELLGADFGVFYLRSGDKLVKHSSYAAGGETPGAESFRLGEGLIGQCAAENRIYLLEQVPDHHIKITTGLGASEPHSIMIVPIEHEGRVYGVLEFASLGAFTPQHQKLVEQTRRTIGMMINNVLNQMEVKRLLEESQAMSEELQQQTEELTAQSEELMAQQDELKSANDSLRQTEARLKRQQEDLEANNDELTKRSDQLLLNARRMQETNVRIEEQRSLLEQQANDLMTASRYKSEFLANMSHELRTPLNSLLILSQLLAENREGNLQTKQIEFASTIHSAGSDLLRLIDEILDLSKIESGQMKVELEPVSWDEILGSLEGSFRTLAEKKHIQFILNVEEGVRSKKLVTDSHRLLQILKNLLSNAFKFTNQGHVQLRIADSTGKEGEPEFTFSVTDTGIGIAEEKKAIIFEAFQQADGSTSRKYGGTGLGLTISRDLALMLGGRIEVESSEGAGSHFTLFLPADPKAELEQSREEVAVAAVEEVKSPGLLPAPDVLAPLQPETDPEWAGAEELPDDRFDLQPGDRVLLIIEDDSRFARILMDQVRERKFKAIVAQQGDQGLALANMYKPDAIILDIELPVIDGWSVLERLKQQPELRHIPVHVISVVDEPQQGLLKGAIAYLQKPVDREGLEKALYRIEYFLDRSVKRLMIVEDDALLLDSMVHLMQHDDVMIKAVSTGQEALDELEKSHYDCMVLDLGLGDISGFEILDRIRQKEELRQLPIIIYTGRELSRKEEIEIRKYAESIIIKNVKSQERLFDETALFLHRVEAELPENRRLILKKLYKDEDLFRGKRILLVEDDIRNIFALTNVLQSHQLNVTFVENGREALELLETDPHFDLILMDIMMPELDGYQAMTAIRQMSALETVPIIALTAKAMKEDRQRCIDMGASDYISKPIDIEKLLSLLKVWLYK